MSDGGDDPSRAELVSLLEFYVGLLPVAAAAICTLGHPFTIESIASTTQTAGDLDEAQIAFGEGPAWDAIDTHPIHLQTDLNEHRRRWPLLIPTLVEHGVRAVTALSLHSGALAIGAVSLYRTPTAELTDQQLLLAGDLGILLARSAAPLADRTIDDAPQTPRADARAAVRTLSALTEVPPAEALLTVRAFASRTGRSLHDIAAEISDGHFPFPRDPP